MGSLTHYINMRASGYHDLPPFPEVAPDPTARNISEPVSSSPKASSHLKKGAKEKPFYAESDSSPADEGNFIRKMFYCLLGIMGIYIYLYLQILRLRMKTVAMSKKKMIRVTIKKTVQVIVTVIQIQIHNLTPL